MEHRVVSFVLGNVSPFSAFLSVARAGKSVMKYHHSCECLIQVMCNWTSPKAIQERPSRGLYLFRLSIQGHSNRCSNRPNHLFPFLKSFGTLERLKSDGTHPRQTNSISANRTSKNCPKRLLLRLQQCNWKNQSKMISQWNHLVDLLFSADPKIRRTTWSACSRKIFLERKRGRDPRIYGYFKRCQCLQGPRPIDELSGSSARSVRFRHETVKHLSRVTWKRNSLHRSGRQNRFGLSWIKGVVLTTQIWGKAYKIYTVAMPHCTVQITSKVMRRVRKRCRTWLSRQFGYRIAEYILL